MRLFILFILFVVIFSSCRETSKLDVAGIKKLKPDTDYYCAESKAWLRFTELSPEIKGYFFVDSGRAFVTRCPFYIEKKKRNYKVWYNNGKLKGVKLDSFEVNDTSFTVSGDDLKATFVLERGQPFPSQSKRYIEPITEKYSVVTVKYGNAKGYYSAKVVEQITEDKYPEILIDVSKSIAKNFLMNDLFMEMDIYTPNGDTCTKRPLLVLFHGGAFMLGDKGTLTMKELGEYFVKRGYVVASVNYRLGFWFVPGSYYFLERAIYRATQDAHASIRYLVSNAGKLGIDTAHIYTGGNSAGGFLALNVAMMKDGSYYPSHVANAKFLLDDLGCLECSTNSLKNKFRVKAVVDMWGALTHIRMLTENPDLPIICFHGSEDRIIPTGHDYPFAKMSLETSRIFTEKVFGSEILYKYSKVTKTPVKLKIFEGFGHDPHMNDDGTINPCFDTVKTMTRDFLYTFLKAPVPEIKGPQKPKTDDPVSEYSVTNSGGCSIFWNVSGGKLLNVPGSATKKKVIWFRGAENILNVALRNKNLDVSFNKLKVTPM